MTSITKAGRGSTLITTKNSKTNKKQERKCFLAEAKTALEDIVVNIDVQGIPVELWSEPLSPYYILNDVVNQYKEKQKQSEAVTIDIFHDIIKEKIDIIQKRINKKLIPFYGSNDEILHVLDDTFLRTVQIKHDDIVEIDEIEDNVCFMLDKSTLDVDTSFGLYCNTPNNEDYVDIYLKWSPDCSGFNASNMGELELLVIYQTEMESRELPVRLSSKQRQILMFRLPQMICSALDDTVENIYEKWRKVRENSVFNNSYYIVKDY